MALDKLRKELKKECPPDHWVWKMEVTLKRLKKNKKFMRDLLVNLWYVLPQPSLVIKPLNADMTKIAIKEYQK